MSSEAFSSAIKSQKTINEMQVNLTKPGPNQSVPLQMCATSYEMGDTSSHYTEESSMVSAEYAAMTHEEQAQRRKEDKDMKLMSF